MSLVPSGTDNHWVAVHDGEPIGIGTGTGFSGTNVTGSITLNNSGMSLALSAGAGGGGGVGLSAGTQSVSTGTVIFANSNNFTWGMSGSSQVTASWGGQTAQSIGIYASSQTTGASSSSTVDARSLTIVGAGAISAGMTNGSVIVSAPNTVALTQFSAGISTGGNTAGNTGVVTAQLVLAGLNLTLSGSTNGGSETVTVSAPATSSLVGAQGISVSTNGSTMSVQATPLSRWINTPENITAVTAPGNASASINYWPIFWPVTATRIDALFSISMGSSATTNTAALALSVYAGIYTRNANTLSSLSSGSTQTTYSYASNSAGQTQLLSAAVRPISVPVNILATPGEYFVAFNMVTATSSIGASTTSFAPSISIMGANQVQTATNYQEFSAQTATSTNLYGGQGVYSAATTGLPAAISLSAINQTGSALSAANIVLVMRNV